MANIGSSIPFGKAYLAYNVNAPSEEDAVLLFEKITEVLHDFRENYATRSEK